MSVWRCLINNSSLVDDLRGLDFFLIHLDDSKTYPLISWILKLRYDAIFYEIISHGRNYLPNMTSGNHLS